METKGARAKAIALKEVNKSIGEKHILKDVSFDIFTNEILALIGPNGAGKTITIRCISGIYKIDSGAIEKNGNLRISVMSEKDFLWEGDTRHKIYFAVLFIVFAFLARAFNIKILPVDVVKIFIYATIVNTGVSTFISSVVMKIRRVALMRFVTIASVFALGYGGNVLINATVKNFHGDIFRLLLLVSIAMGGAFFLPGLLIGKSVDEETVVLTIPE